jgi:anti-sigma-K factor RskA
MKDFDARWQECAKRARQAPAREDTAPFGFASRVVARAFPIKGLSQVEVFWHLALRMLTGAVAVMILCMAMELPHLRGPRPLEIGVEDTVAQLVWSL